MLGKASGKQVGRVKVKAKQRGVYLGGLRMMMMLVIVTLEESVAPDLRDYSGLPLFSCDSTVRSKADSPGFRAGCSLP